MDISKVFAVVDVETTNTAIEEQSRIIQFSCVLVQNNKIINEFNTLINPLTDIPLEVQKLTGIKPKMVEDAPIFEDVAGIVYSMLENTIFVAHNINFDYRFVNEELSRVGFPELDIDGIDTVQLTQIFYPTLQSYRLQDITKQLQISHEHPHRADSDAKVTALLFIKLTKKIKNLPKQLLQQLTKLSDNLIYESGDYIKELSKQQAENSSEYKLVGQLVLANSTKVSEKSVNFSKNFVADKQFYTSLKPHVSYRAQQAKLMNDIYREVNVYSKREVIFSAPTGLGKTLGYLVPLVKSLKENTRIVVATADTSLQNQIYEKDIPQLKDMLNVYFSTVSVKGNAHYIDLQAFVTSLETEQEKYIYPLQMKILVWLSETQTGDLDEMKTSPSQEPYLEKIRHHGLSTLSTDSPYYTEDFLYKLQHEISDSQVIITNHSYLLSHANELTSNGESILVVDEAQHLPEVALTDNRQELDFDQIKILADTILVKMQSHINYSFNNLLAQGIMDITKYHQMKSAIQYIDHEIIPFRQKFINRFMNLKNRSVIIHTDVDINKLKGFIKENIDVVGKVSTCINQVDKMTKELFYQYKEWYRLGRLDHNSVSLLEDYFSLVQQLLDSLNNWQYLNLDFLDSVKIDYAFWLTLTRHEGGHLRYNVGLLDTKDFLSKKLYINFDKVLLIGADLGIKQTQKFIKNQLDIPGRIKVYRYKSDFDYSNQSCALILQDGPNVNELNYNEYIDKLSILVSKITQHHDKQAMILFNSLDVINDVYRRLGSMKIERFDDILAQGVDGSNNKIRKLFLNSSTKKVLLATGSFWQGIDLPKDKLEILVMTRLPFQPFDTTINKIRYNRIKQANKNPFTRLALPQAIIRFSQGVGRLIRTQEDRGILVISDSRILTQNYGQKFIDSLPSPMPVKIIDSVDINNEIQNFFEKRQ